LSILIVNCDLWFLFSLRDTLRLLTLWFNYGSKHKAVREALIEGFGFQDSPPQTASTTSSTNPRTLRSSGSRSSLNPTQQSSSSSTYLPTVPKTVSENG
jgi:hypothetical protein